jgi:outer membrane murein-binding lipoprotein Lpp
MAEPQTPDGQVVPAAPDGGGLYLSKRNTSILVSILLVLLTGGTIGGFSLGGGADKAEVQELKTEVQALTIQIEAMKTQIDQLNRTFERVEDRLDRVIDGN